MVYKVCFCWVLKRSFSKLLLVVVWGRRGSFVSEGFRCFFFSSLRMGDEGAFEEDMELADYVPTKFLGSGTFGKAFLAVDKRNGKKVGFERCEAAWRTVDLVKLKGFFCASGL